MLRPPSLDILFRLTRSRAFGGGRYNVLAVRARMLEGSQRRIKSHCLRKVNGVNYEPNLVKLSAGTSSGRPRKDSRKAASEGPNN